MPRASMGPHVFACGNRQCPACLAHIGAGASMGPHVFACGNSEQRESATKAGLASMGPHVFACGNVLGTAVCGRAIPGFNGAARFCVRKCNGERGRGRTGTGLQWGRTFLRAEIVWCGSRPVQPPQGLQWGRTFLRAEITLTTTGQFIFSMLQWGRTFLRAEMRVAGIR